MSRMFLIRGNSSPSLKLSCLPLGKLRLYFVIWVTHWHVIMVDHYPARARSVRAQRACALRALGLLLADGAPTVGRGKTFWRVGQVFFKKTAITRERKVKNRSQDGKWTVSPRATNGRLTKIGVVCQKSDFWAKNLGFWSLGSIFWLSVPELQQFL